MSRSAVPKCYEMVSECAETVTHDGARCFVQ